MYVRAAALASAFALLAATAAPARAEETTRVSLDAFGGDADNESYRPTLSASGRFVAFVSFATDLVPGDGNGQADVFVHDRKTRLTTRVSVGPGGAEVGGLSLNPAISANGRFVAFDSSADDLVPGDGNERNDVFVHDRKTGVTSRVSVGSAGEEGDDGSYTPSISANGRFVAISSDATNLVPNDGNAVRDAFVHDRKTGETTRATVDSAGVESDGGTSVPDISGNGRFVAFHSAGTNLVAGDGNDEVDVFVHDRKTGETTRVSVASDGSEGDANSQSPDVSGNGRFVAFYSDATTLVLADGNAERDAFIHDRKTGETTRVSVATGGVESGGGSSPILSASGRLVAFASAAGDLVAADGNGAFDIFLHDRKTGETTRVSADLAGGDADDASEGPAALSASGRFVAFDSFASDLVGDDENDLLDVFVLDRK